MYITRHLEKQVLEASRFYPVVMVCGQRQVGKSTMLNHIREPERKYVTLDDGNARRLAETDPALFFETYGSPLLIDEFQRVPSILLEMKNIVDKKALNGENNNGMYWLTGSQKFHMMKDVSDSLAGRVAVFDMSGISAPTAKAWVSILERSGVIYLLRPYYSNISKRLIKTPKVYFMDTGLAAYLCRWPTAETLMSGAMDGALLETYAISEIVKSCLNAGRPADLFYYRDIDQKEIDLLMIKGDKLYPLEIKKSKSPAQPDKNFHVLQKFKLDMQPGMILCMSDELIPYNRETWYCPVAVL